MRILQVLSLTLALALPAKAQNCTPTLVLEGKPCIGQMVDFIGCVQPGCGICLLVSALPGPFTFQGYTFNVGVPFFPLFETVMTQPCFVLWVTIPNLPSIVGANLYYQIFGYNPVPPLSINLGSSGVITICP